MRAHCGFLSSDPAARAARRTLRLVPPARGRLQVRSRPHGSSGSGTEGRLRASSGTRAHRTGSFLHQLCPHYLPVIRVESSVLPLQSPRGWKGKDLSGRAPCRQVAAPASKPCPQRKITWEKAASPRAFQGPRSRARGDAPREHGPGCCVRLQTGTPKAGG